MDRQHQEGQGAWGWGGGGADGGGKDPMCTKKGHGEVSSLPAQRSPKIARVVAHGFQQEEEVFQLVCPAFAADNSVV